jgi:colanic acid/amylovoran biosynthesis glycosyltransferase
LPDTDDRPAVAYLATFYPLLSQQFVRREVEALRAGGLTVLTVAVRPTPAGQVRSEADRREQERTTVILDGARVAFLRELLATVVAHPSAFLSTLRLALRSGDRSPRSLVWQVFYLVEAVRLSVLLRKARIRHVHVHFANNAADVARLATHLMTAIDPARPATWSLAMHGPTEFMDVTRFDLAAKVRSAAFVACISDYARSQLMTLVEPDHWPKLSVVHMGVDTRHFPSYADERAARPAGPVRVLFVGRLVPEKGVPVLLDAVEELARRGCAVQVRVAGDSPLRERLQDEASLRFGDTVTFLGPVSPDDLPELYGWADVFCLPSFAEGVPVVLMEAMATGLPVVTTAIAGIPELVRNGDTGVLVPAGRADLVADAIQSLAADRERRRQLGAAGRALVLADYDAHSAAQHLLPLLDPRRKAPAPDHRG